MLSLHVCAVLCVILTLSNEIQPVHSEGDQPWDFFGRNDAKAETPVLWPPHAKVDSLEKTLMLGGIGGRRHHLQPFQSHVSIILGTLAPPEP